MRGVVISPLANPSSPASRHASSKKVPHTSVPFPHSAVFIVRIYDVGRTFVPLSPPHTQGEGRMQSYSSGLFALCLHPLTHPLS
jgi:hypothetical protein